jgi:rhodanese-related sulfurtransferase
MNSAEPENKKDLLKRSILRDLPLNELEGLSRTLECRAAVPGELIFKEGDPADAFYIVFSGQVRVFVRHENRIERELSVCGPGEHFGEVALLAGATRTANVQSIGETSLMVFPKELFDRLLRDYPDLSRKFVGEMRGWLMKDQEIIEEEASVVWQASRISMLDFLLVVGVSILLAITFNFSNPYGIPLIPERPDAEAISTISATEAMQASRKGQAIIVDAMPSNFYQQRHVKGAVNMPMALFDIVYLMKFSDEDKAREVVVYGNTISRPYDLEIAGKLALRGYSDVKVMNGGLKAWEAGGYPVEEQVSK